MIFNENDYGEFIRNRRKDLSIKQNQLAEALNCTPQAISKYENGKSSINLTILGDLCRILQVDIDSFLTLKTEKMNDDCDKYSFSSKMFAQNLNFLREKKKMTQGEFAKALSVSSQKVSKWENSSSLPSLDELQILSNFLKLSCSSLYFAIDETNSSTDEAKEETKAISTNSPVSSFGNKKKLFAFAIIILLIICIVVFLCILLPKTSNQTSSSPSSLPSSTQNDSDAPFINSFDFEPLI